MLQDKLRLISSKKFKSDSVCFFIYIMDNTFDGPSIGSTYYMLQIITL